jgi:hypothetical protein
MWITSEAIFDSKLFNRNFPLVTSNKAVPAKGHSHTLAKGPKTCFSSLVTKLRPLFKLSRCETVVGEDGPLSPLLSSVATYTAASGVSGLGARTWSQSSTSNSADSRCNVGMKYRAISDEATRYPKLSVDIELLLWLVGHFSYLIAGHLQ